LAKRGKRTSTAARKGRKRRAGHDVRYSRLGPPAGLAAQAWQTALRRQFGREQDFVLENVGDEPVFSEFRVSNPESGGRYRVAIRGFALGDNYCSCPDFATNDLGTCKHVEFTLARLARTRRGRAALEKGYLPPYSEIYLRYGAQRTVHFRAGTRCPASLRRAASALFDSGAGWRLPQERFSDVDSLLSKVRAGHELRVYDDALDFIAQVRDAGRREALLRKAYPAGAQSAVLRRLLREPLHPYQAEGALFAARAGRCLIGDDMGLGKTVQAIAAAEMLTKHLGVERVLVICPASLKHQWERELERFTGRKALVIGGGQAARRKLYGAPDGWKIAAYDTIARDLDFIQRWSPDLVIADEAQRVKNWNTIAARALKRIRSPYAFVLTGTPLENRLEELISIVQFVDQHRLGPTWRLLDAHQVRDESGRVVGYRDLAAIARTLAPVMIRRRKSEVLAQLPERIDKNVFVAMTPQQVAVHEENREIVGRIVKKWRRSRFLSDAEQRMLTCALQRMRMSCNSTWLIDRETDHGVKAGELIAFLEDLFEDPAAKAVVFSQWVGTHELVARRLADRKWKYVLFHGGVPSEKRKGLVDCFRLDPECRLFLSTDAGGVGLNLQHAATVVNMDQPWNPAVLEQRIARVHRMGQRNVVQVVNFIAQGTIEEGMLSLLGFKKALFAGVLDGGQTEVSLGGSRLARFIEGVEKATGGLARPQVEEPVAPEVPAGPGEPLDVPGTSPEATDAAAIAREPGDGGNGQAAAAWHGLIAAGLHLATQVLSAARGPASGDGPGSGHALLETDPGTGRRYLKLPLPDQGTLDKLVEALAALTRR
jgi:superfamily II DNA or RNA helicase